MLDRSDPPLLAREFDWAVIEQVAAIQLFGLFAVVNDRPGKRIGVDVKHRSLDFRGAALYAYVLGTSPLCFRPIRHDLLQADAVAAAAERVALLDADAAGVGPRQRHHEFLGVAELIVVLAGRERRQVRRFRCAGRRPHARFDQPERLARYIE